MLPVYDLLTSAGHGATGIDHRLLHAILDRGEEAIPDIVRFSSEDFVLLPVNLEGLLVDLFRYFNTPLAVPFYVSVIRADLHEVPDEVTTAVVALGRPMLDPLIELYRTLDEDEAEATAFLLAALGVRDERILEILLDRLEYDTMEGALAVGIYGDPEAVSSIERVLAEIPDEDTQLRHLLQSAIETLKSPTAAIADPPFDIWEEYPEEALPNFSVLSEEDRVALLSHELADFRAGAAHSFFNQEFSLVTRAKLLETARADSDEDVRARAWEALIDVAEEAEVRKSMLAVIDNPEAPLAEKGGAIVGLALQNQNPKVRAAMESFYLIPEIRSKALEAMWRSLDRTFAPYFPKHLDDPDLEVQRQAIWGVGYLGIQSESKRLERFFDDDDLRSDALFAFALAVPADISPGRARALYRKIETVSGGLSEGEGELVKLALDERLFLHGHEAVFFPSKDDPELEGVAASDAIEKPRRNDPCSCGSGKKYKKCHGA